MKIIQPTICNLEPQKVFTPTLTLFSFCSRAGKRVVQSKYLKNASSLFGIYTKNARAKRKLVSGFTLIETLVAISILLLAIGGPLTIAAQSYFTARFSKDRLMATYLAQEGIEIIRHRRDSNSLAGVDWLSGLSNCLGGKCFRGAFTNSPTFNACSASCVPLGYNEITGQYGYGSIPVSKYTREISIQELSETEVVVTSIVKWNNGNIQRQVQLKEALHDWQ